MQVKSQIVYEYIENKIMLGEFKPGDKIPSESRLCEELNLSRVSVRSGIEKLISIGLLKKQKFGGTYVSQQNDDNYMKILTPTLSLNFNYIEMLELRQSLDTLSVELCINNLNNEVIDALKLLLEDMERFEESDDFFELDRKFHLTISKFSYNRLLHNISEIVWEVLESNARDQYHLIGNTKRIEEHKKILNAMISNDLDLARIYSKRHLIRTIEDVKERD